jgi:trans-aconitate methyltransferase
VTDNTHKFDGLADIYDASRPDYPQSAIEHLARMARATALPAICLDIGAGTGISTRAIAAALPGWQVRGIEPNADMSRRAAQSLASLPQVTIETATAENLPAAHRTVGLIVVAQAFHWFDRPRFFIEAARVLAANGILAIMNNNRETAASAPLSAVEDFLERENQGYSRHYRDIDITDELQAQAALCETERTVHVWQRHVTPASLADYFLSRSSAPPIVARLGLTETRARLVAIIEANAGTAPFTIPIACELITARRRA